MPNSRMGTDWTTVSSYHDGIVSEASGVAGNAEHEMKYSAGLSHNELRTVTSGYHRARKKEGSGSWARGATAMAPPGVGDLLRRVLPQGPRPPCVPSVPVEVTET